MNILPLKNFAISTLPRLVSGMLMTSTEKVQHLKNSLTTKERKVYDLLSVEHGHKFVVYGKTPMVVSNCVQGGGHDLQMMFGMYVADAVKEAGLDARPFIYDLHDATYWEVREDQLEEYLKLSTAAADKVWEWCKNELGWNCKLSVSAAYGKTLRELKGY